MSAPLEPLPSRELRDNVRTGVDAGIAAIPLVGGSIQTLAEVVVAPSLQKRRDAWLAKLAELLNELAEKVDGFAAEDLAGNEEFVTAVADASRIAMGTHLEAKLEMLKNCLAHMVVDTDRDTFTDVQFFRMVDDLSPEHFVILQYLQNPGAWFDARKIQRPEVVSGSPRSIMAVAQLPLDGDALGMVLRDLQALGLANTTSLDTTMTAAGAWQRLANDLGLRLLQFVATV